MKRSFEFSDDFYAKLVAAADAYDTNVTAIIKIACAEFLLKADRKRVAAGWKPLDAGAVVWMETGPDTMGPLDRDDLTLLNS